MWGVCEAKRVGFFYRDPSDVRFLNFRTQLR